MTAAEWGRSGPGAPSAAPEAARWSPGLFGRVEYGAAALLLLLLSQALLGPLFNPTQDADAAGWLRGIWLPIYGVILVLAAARFRSLPKVATGALLVAPLLLLAFASTQWSILPDVTLRRSVALTFTTLFGLWLAARFSWRELMGLLAVVFAILAVGSYAAALLAPDFGVHSEIHPGAWRGLWYEKNTMGAAMATGALACAAAAVMLPAWRWPAVGGAVLCAGLVVLSTSTTSLLALLLVGGGMAAVAGVRWNAASAVTTVWVGLVAAGIAAAVYTFAPDLVFDALGKDETLTGRTDIWAAVLRRVGERPLLGYGFGAFWEDRTGPVGFVRSEVDWLAPTAHNGWLELLLSFGWTGAALFGLHLAIASAAALVSIGRGPQAYWSLIFTALFVLFSLSESTILQQNNLTWALYVMTGAKLLGPRDPELQPRAATGRPTQSEVRSIPAARAPQPARPLDLPGATPLTFGLGVVALLILSRTWMPVLFGDPSAQAEGGRADIVYLFAYLAAFLLSLSRLGETLQLGVRAPLYLALLGLAAASVLWSIDPGDTLLSVVALCGTSLAGVALAARFSWSELAEVLAAAFAVIILGCFAAALFTPEIGRHVGYDGAWRGLFGHKNNLGGAMATAIPLFVAAAAYNRRRLWLWAGFGLLAAVLLVLSGSKTALMATFLALAVLIGVTLVRRGGASAVAATYSGLLLVSAAALLALFGREAVFEWLGKDATLTGRTEIWTAAMRQIGERPWLGFGYSTLWNPDAPNTPTAWMFVEARHEVSHAHNSWLEIWLGVGLLGAIVFSLLLVKSWADVLAAAYRRHGAALLAAPFLLAYTVTALTESVALNYNDLRWAMFTAIAVKLARWGQDPMAVRADGSERRTSA